MAASNQTLYSRDTLMAAAVKAVSDCVTSANEAIHAARQAQAWYEKFHQEGGGGGIPEEMLQEYARLDGAHFTGNIAAPAVECEGTVNAESLTAGSLVVATISPGMAPEVKVDGSLRLTGSFSAMSGIDVEGSVRIKSGLEAQGRTELNETHVRTLQVTASLDSAATIQQPALTFDGEYSQSPIRVFATYSSITNIDLVADQVTTGWPHTKNPYGYVLNPQARKDAYYHVQYSSAPSEHESSFEDGFNMLYTRLTRDLEVPSEQQYLHTTYVNIPGPVKYDANTSEWGMLHPEVTKCNEVTQASWNLYKFGKHGYRYVVSLTYIPVRNKYAMAVLHSYPYNANAEWKDLDFDVDLQQRCPYGAVVPGARTGRMAALRSAMTLDIDPIDEDLDLTE